MSAPLTTSQRRFSLRDIFIATTALAVVFAVAAQVPHAQLFRAAKSVPALAFFTAILSLLPLGIANLVCVIVVRILLAPGSTTDRSRGLRPFAPHRLLLQAGTDDPPSWALSITIAVACTCVTVLLWPLIRELGLAVSLMLSGGVAVGMPSLKAIPKLLSKPAFLWSLTNWEAFSISRWWLLYSALLAIWIVTPWPWRARLKLEPLSNTIRRLLAFAPWLVVVEIAFLVGIWTLTPAVVPEPSTAFVEGVFRWHMWQWNCWQGITTINRGLIPTFALSTLFFMSVLRWRWPASVALAACLAPLALIFFIAWVVLYTN